MVVNDLFYQRIATLVAAGILLYLLYLLFPVLVPFIVAMVLAYLLNPVAKWLGKFGIPRWLGILLIFGLVGTVLVTAIAILIPTLIHQFELGRENLPKFFEWLNGDALPWIASTFKINLSTVNFDAASASVMEYLQKNYDVQDAGSLLGKIATSGASAIGAFGLFVLVPVVAFFYMLSWDDMVDKLKNTIPLRYRAKTLSLAQECHSVMMAFVKGQLLVMLLLGIMYAIGLEFLVGLDTGLFIGLMAGLASIVPYLGIVIGVVAALIAAIVQFGFEWWVLTVLAVFAVGQFVEGNFLQPIVLGDRIGLSPVMVILAVLVGGQLMGLAGMLIALPLAAIIMVLFRHAMAAYKRSDLYRKQANGEIIDEAALNDEIHAKLAEPVVAQPVTPTDFAWVAVADTLPKPEQPKHTGQKGNGNNRRRSNNRNQNNRNQGSNRNQNRNRNNQNRSDTNGKQQRSQHEGQQRKDGQQGSSNNRNRNRNSNNRNRNNRRSSSQDHSQRQSNQQNDVSRDA